MKNPMLLPSFTQKIDPNSILGRLKAETLKKHSLHGYQETIPIYFADFMKEYPIPNTEYVINLPSSSDQEQERTNLNILQWALHRLSRESIIISQVWTIDKSAKIEELDTDILLICKFDLNFEPHPFGEDYHFFNFMENWFNDLIITFINASGDDAIYDYWPNYYALFQETLFAAGREELEQQCTDYLTHIRPDFFED